MGEAPAKFRFPKKVPEFGDALMCHRENGERAFMIVVDRRLRFRADRGPELFCEVEDPYGDGEVYEVAFDCKRLARRAL